MKINGKEVNILIDFGALEILYDEEKIDYMAHSRRMFMELQKGKTEEEIISQFNNLAVTKGLLYAGAKRYAEENDTNVPITKDDVKRMSIMEYTIAEMEITLMISDFTPEKKDTKKKKTSSKNVKSLNSV